jgi:hypothetical protein
MAESWGQRLPRGAWFAIVASAAVGAIGAGVWLYTSRDASLQVAVTAQESADSSPPASEAASDVAETPVAPSEDPLDAAAMSGDDAVEETRTLESEAIDAAATPESEVVDDAVAPESDETPVADGSQIANAPMDNLGDRWVPEVIDHQDPKLSYRAERIVTAVGEDRIVTSVRTLGKDYVRNVEYNGQWAVAASYLRSGATTSFSPVLPYLSFPAQPGKSWDVRVVETDATGGQKLHEVHAKMESWEMVQVPAGTFRALKVVLIDDISKDGVLVQQGKDVSWYAPDVKRTVKTEESSFDPATNEPRRRTISLIEYSVQ